MKYTASSTMVGATGVSSLPSAPASGRCSPIESVTVVGTRIRIVFKKGTNKEGHGDDDRDGEEKIPHKKGSCSDLLTTANPNRQDNANLKDSSGYASMPTAKLESSKRKLADGYERAKNAKKLRAIQVLEPKDMTSKNLVANSVKISKENLGCSSSAKSSDQTAVSSFNQDAVAKRKLLDRHQRAEESKNQHIVQRNLDLGSGCGEVEKKHTASKKPKGTTAIVSSSSSSSPHPLKSAGRKSLVSKQAEDEMMGVKKFAGNNKNYDDESMMAKLEKAKSKLHEGYKIAETAKNQRVIKVLEINQVAVPKISKRGGSSAGGKESRPVKHPIFKLRAELRRR